MAAAATAACSDDLCGNDNVRSFRSTDGARTAYLFRRACGATTDFSTHVSLVAAGRALPNGAGNVLSVGGEQPVELVWMNSTTLRVTGFREPVYLRASTVDSISVQYQ